MSTAALPINAINDALSRGRPQDAERLTRDFLRQSPTDPDGLILLGLCLREQERWTEAVGPFSQLTRLQPRSALHWSNLGTALRSAGQMREAEDAYRRAIERFPDPRLLGFLPRDCAPQVPLLGTLASASRPAT